MTDDVPKPCLSRSHTDRLRCCLPQGHKGEHTNQLVTDVQQVKWIDEPKFAALPARPTASTITDTQLDHLHAENDRLTAELGDYDQRVQQLDAELAALRAVARGYCPHCGRGDAAPTVHDWEQQKRRADKAEAALAHLQATSEAAGRLLTRTTDERDEARQHAAAIAAQRDRLRHRMNALADRWDNALAVDKPYARTLRAEISVAPFHPDVSLVVQQYRADDGTQKWAVRCWGTDTCDGFLSLDHDTEQWAARARDRHAGAQPDRNAQVYGDHLDVYSAIVAVATLTGCHWSNEWQCCGYWAFERAYHWTLTDVIALPEPVPAAGALGFWTPKPDVLAAVQAQTAQPAV